MRFFLFRIFQLFSAKVYKFKGHEDEDLECAQKNREKKFEKEVDKDLKKIKKRMKAIQESLKVLQQESGR